ncbi:hypothetical protein EDD86DRAFT_208757 [Gorgonomyces haynaldii]|nr:hypothetical protein EDD86DRAFT_208757 [Gorgonomyces haynaldii]
MSDCAILKAAWNQLTSSQFHTVCCDGVTIFCDVFDRIIKIDLQKIGVEGSLPPSLVNLKNLEYLDLGSNRLKGGLPAEWGNFAKLNVLYLDNNQLTGAIPPSWAQLNLRTFQSINNQLTGSVPLGLVSAATTNCRLGNKLCSDTPVAPGCDALPACAKTNVAVPPVIQPSPAVIKAEPSVTVQSSPLPSTDTTDRQSDRSAPDGPVVEIGANPAASPFSTGVPTVNSATPTSYVFGAVAGVLALVASLIAISMFVKNKKRRLFPLDTKTPQLKPMEKEDPESGSVSPVWKSSMMKSFVSNESMKLQRKSVGWEVESVVPVQSLSDSVIGKRHDSGLLPSIDYFDPRVSNGSVQLPKKIAERLSVRLSRLPTIRLSQATTEPGSPKPLETVQE